MLLEYKILTINYLKLLILMHTGATHANTMKKINIQSKYMKLVNHTLQQGSCHKVVHLRRAQHHTGHHIGGSSAPPP